MTVRSESRETLTALALNRTPNRVGISTCTPDEAKKDHPPTTPILYPHPLFLPPNKTWKLHPPLLSSFLLDLTLPYPTSPAKFNQSRAP